MAGALSVFATTRIVLRNVLGSLLAIAATKATATGNLTRTGGKIAGLHVHLSSSLRVHWHKWFEWGRIASHVVAASAPILCVLLAATLRVLDVSGLSAQAVGAYLNPPSVLHRR